MKFIGKVSIVLIAGFLSLFLISLSLEPIILERGFPVLQIDSVKTFNNNEELESKIAEYDEDKDSNANNNGFDSDNHAIYDLTTKPIFTNEALTKKIVDRVSGVSWREEAPVGLEDLSYITVTHWGFDQQEYIGELIVHKEVGEEVLEIFQELYEAKFPIEKMRLIDEYKADDHLSMEDNNTSAFCFRVIEGSQKISNHGYGVAIDINPIQNPYIKNNRIVPLAGKEYVNREDIRKGMIIKGDPCYRAFTSRGWTWGGEWKIVKDYQHFEKVIDLNP